MVFKGVCIYFKNSNFENSNFVKYFIIEIKKVINEFYLKLYNIIFIFIYKNDLNISIKIV